MLKNSLPRAINIKVVGLGGAGCNAVSRMVQEHLGEVDVIAMNTDARHLAITEASRRIQLGGSITHGLGAGGDAAAGLRAAEESREEIERVLTGADMVFITAGMGGGTGTGSAPLVAEIARHSGALTVAVVTRPFNFEGKHRLDIAEAGIASLVAKVDTLIVIPNERLLEISESKAGVDNAFKMADDVLLQSVKSIVDIITVPGLINIDFATLRTIMKDAGRAWISIGKGSGTNRVLDAAQSALSSRLMDLSVEGATRVMYNISYGDSMALTEVKKVAEIIQKAVSPQANIIFGVVAEPKLGNEIRITLIAAGFVDRENQIQQLLQSSRSETELEIPPALRPKRNN